MREICVNSLSARWIFMRISNLLPLKSTQSTCSCFPRLFGVLQWYRKHYLEPNPGTSNWASHINSWPRYPELTCPCFQISQILLHPKCIHYTVPLWKRHLIRYKSFPILIHLWTQNNGLQWNIFWGDEYPHWKVKLPWSTSIFITWNSHRRGRNQSKSYVFRSQLGFH